MIIMCYSAVSVTGSVLCSLNVERNERTASGSVTEGPRTETGLSGKKVEL